MNRCHFYVSAGVLSNTTIVRVEGKSDLYIHGYLGYLGRVER
jgi:hypothetical protein